MPTVYAEIIIPRTIIGNKETLTYEVPEDMQQFLKTGDLVELPLRKANVRGVVLSIHSIKPLFPTKPISKLVEDFYALTETQLKLLKYISKQHFTPLNKAIKLFFPQNIFSRKRSKQIAPPPADGDSFPSAHTLTTEQLQAIKTIRKNPGQVILLHGVTSSGKTEIYRRLTKNNLERGTQTLILVPEISLTPQTVQNFQQQFGQNIAILHSRLTPQEKVIYLTNIARGHHQIIVGSRSAIFAPFPDLGSIIIDEEHEDSYKQDQSPRYHAREIALKMRELSGQKLQIILGSATPSIESYFHAEKGDYIMVGMPSRIPHQNGHQALPIIQVIDLREELRKKNFSIFSEVLQQKLEETFQKKEQSILFLNRRGAASAIICRDCGHTEECPNCTVALTYHSKIIVEESILPAQRLICHHCGRIFKMPTVCKSCQSHLIKYIGLGTQKIEEELQKLLPRARIIRADRDTTRQKDDFEHIYEDFKAGHADILIGTQMIGKGLHLPNVTLGGVVLADTGLTIPDFRSSEKTFQLLTQVSGRSGREKPGTVIIQTYLPEHSAIQNTLQHDYEKFYQQEISQRQKGQLPPFHKVIKITLENTDREKAHYLSHQMFADLESFRNGESSQINEINLYPAFIPKLKNRYRWQILLTGNDPHAFLSNFFLQKPLTSGIKIDVDPLRTI